MGVLSEQEFNQLANEGYDRIPLVWTSLADLNTPLSVYLKLANAPYSYLLESVVGGERFGRYSFIGLPAVTRLVATGDTLSEYYGEELRALTQKVNPLDEISRRITGFKVPEIKGLPRFCGGYAGYFGYNTIRYIEPKLAHSTPPDALGLPDIHLLLTEELAVLDNVSGRIFLIVYADPKESHAYFDALEKLHRLQKKLEQPITVSLPELRQQPGKPVSEQGRAAYEHAVEKARQYIYDGDIMQVVLSHRIKRPFAAQPMALYRALRVLNPSPYMFYYDFGNSQVVGASPEILVRLEDERVTVRPIAGTRPRGKTREQDLALSEELLADPKERAEHLMLVDLGRNDVGRVAVTGSVEVTDCMSIENYSHVMHIVSNVEGRLKPGVSAMDVLKATFPAGTVSGAPKVRAMEIIDELEVSNRSVYAGAVGYLGFNGDMDLAIAIRTALIQDGTLYVQAGAGIVADSIPEKEWEETQNKANAILKAADMAESGFDMAL
ncbi:MAG: anthranilate synthase component I [Proteobacteria bacterium]|nr:anthranilate synthase component I [Pseudomonadota bacterium]MDE3207353.1 anthranilate synthase component I [Pseudomonadota bacterium]